MTDLALYLQAWEKQIANTYEPAYEQLQNDIKSELGSHAVSVVMEDSFILDTGGMSMDEFTEKLEEFQDRKDELDQEKQTEETNLKNFRTNGTNNYNNQLRNSVLACLEGWEEAEAIANEIVDRAIELIY